MVSVWVLGVHHSIGDYAIVHPQHLLKLALFCKLLPLIKVNNIFLKICKLTISTSILFFLKSCKMHLLMKNSAFDPKKKPYFSLLVWNKCSYNFIFTYLKVVFSSLPANCDINVNVVHQFRCTSGAFQI